MKLKEVLDQADKEKVLEFISRDCSSQMNASFKSGNDREFFSNAFDELIAIRPDESSTMALSVSRIEESIEQGEPPYLVCGIESDENGNIRQWGLTLVNREEWLAMELTPDSMAKFTPNEIIAHCLWDMNRFSYCMFGRAVRDARS